MRTTDVAVVGLGAMGSMTLWRLASRGTRCLGIDRHRPPHALGSSHGESRIIRTAYSEGELYVPLVREAWELWRRLEAEACRSLLLATGGLLIGHPAGRLVGGALESARRHGLEHRLLDPAEARRRHPGHRVGDADVVLEEPQAGVLRPEDAVAAALACARRRGAEVRTDTEVRAVVARPGGGVLLDTEDETIEAGAAVVAVGPWLADVLPDLAAAVSVERQIVAWFGVDDPGAFAPDRFAVFIRELAGGGLRYGLPSLDGRTIKLAVHHEGTRVTPASVDRRVSPADVAPLVAFVAACLDGVAVPPVRATVCMYSNTPDEHFLVGRLPGLPGVTLLGGFSGHGFKFAPVVGEVAADLALEGGTRRDIAAFAPERGLAGA